MLEPLLLAATRVSTFDLERPLTNASGFFFERDGRLFLVTSRHVVIDEPTEHHPSHLQIELHTNAENLAESVAFSLPLFDDEGQSLWRQGIDSAGEIDIALVEIDRSALPPTTLYQAFTPEHLADLNKGIEIGSPLLVVGFPLGFHDTLHHMPVARQAAIASAFGLRFKGEGYFLTDARTHRGSSGAPIVMRLPADDKRELPWLLLGVHSSRLDVNRDLELDEALGLNCAWYSDILLTLSE
ncbi:MAG: serine protease [Pseudomonas sp.]